MLELIAELRGHDSQVWSVVWRPLTSQLTSCGGKKILLWTDDGNEVNEMKENGKKVKQWKLMSIVLNEEEDDVAAEYSEVMGSLSHLSPHPSNSNNPNIDQVNPESIPLTNSGTHERTVRNLGWTSDGKALAAVSFDGTGSIWTEGVREKEGVWTCRSKIEGHENEMKGVAWAPSKRQLATCSRDKTVWIHSLTKESQLIDDDSVQQVELLCNAVLSGHSQDVKDVIWHPTQDFVVSASYDNSIRLWAPWSPESLPSTSMNNDHDYDDSDWQCVATLEDHTSTVWSVSFASNGLEFASASDDKTIRIWTSSLYDVPQQLPPSTRSSSQESNSSTPQLSPVTTQSPSVASPMLEPKLGLHPWLYLNPAFRNVNTTVNASNNAAAAILNNKQIDKDVLEQQAPSPLSDNHHPSVVVSNAVVPTTSISSSSTSTILSPLVSTSQWRCSAVIAGYHGRTVYCVAWHPQLDVLATACGDDAIRIFQRVSSSSSSHSSSSMDKPQWSLVHCLYHAHSSDVNSVSWKSIPEDDGSWLLASGGDDGVVRIFKWNLNEEEKD